MTKARARTLSDEYSLASINKVSDERSPIVIKSHETSLFQRMIDSFKRSLPEENVSHAVNDSNLTDIEDNEEGKIGNGLHRSLKNRHLQMIAIGGSIGNGLFVVSGSALASGGPAPLIFNFIITGFMLFNVAMTLGELSVTFPISGSFASHGSRFLDPAWGFAMGWNYAMNWLIALPIELTSAGLIISFWTKDINIAVWITIFLVALLFINLFGVRGYAEVEFYISIIKVVAVVGFIFLGIILVFGGGPNHEYIGGRYWHDPGPLAHGFKGVLSVFVTAAYAFSGTELVGLAAAETENPRKTIPRATKQVFWRILIFYIISLTLIGCLVPYTHPCLLNKCNVNASCISNTSTSPFVIAIQDADIQILPSIFNAVILCAVLSVGNSSVYGASRTLCALAENGQAPKILAYIDRKGRPLASIFVSILVACIAYINCADVGPKVLNWLVALSGLSSFFTWGSICACHIMFRLAWKAQGHTLDELAFAAPFGIVGSCIGLALNILCLIAQFYVAVVPLCTEFSVADFFQSYLAAPVVLIFYVVWKVWKKPSFMRPSTIDLITGRRHLNTVELIAEERVEHVSYNQPKLPRCPQWDSNGITFADKTIIGVEPLDVFVDRNDIVYAVDVSNKEIHIWNVGDTTPMTILLNNFISPWGLFVTIEKDIYVGTDRNGNVQKRTLNDSDNEGIIVMNASSPCAGLFVDIINYLYCSLGAKNQVVKQSLNDSANTFIVSAGNGTGGLASNLLHEPRGIFVDLNFNLYVADCFNHRIQFFPFGESDGTTVAGSSSISNINLQYPTAIFLDEDGDMFIVDNSNHRIVKTQSTGLYCIIGCLTVSGSASDYLHYPYAAAFDSYGNIFVADQNNNRIQKFMLSKTTINNSSIVESEYSSILSNNSPTFMPNTCGGLYYYYKAIQLDVIETGCYDLISNSTIAMHGYIYKNNFIPHHPTLNLFLQNDQNYHKNYFDFQTQLIINTKYILVVTMFDVNITEPFSIIATGPKAVKFTSIRSTSKIIRSRYSSALTKHSEKYGRSQCKSMNFYYEVIQINVTASGYYTFSSDSNFDIYAYFYKDYFDPFDINKNFILKIDDGCINSQFTFAYYLQSNTTYILVVTTFHSETTGTFSIIVSGEYSVTFTPLIYQSMYESELTTQTSIYSRICGRTNYHYESIQIRAQQNGAYRFASNSTIITYGYLYKDDFNPLDPSKNILAQSGYDCDGYHFDFTAYLQMNKIYMLIVTTVEPNIQGSFLVSVIGANNVSLNFLVKTIDSCAISDGCNSYTKSIGLTLDDILRNEILPNTALFRQSFLIQISIALIIIMFVSNVASSFFSLVTFSNEDVRKVGCGLYLITLSITSLVTIVLFMVKFWFLLLTGTNNIINSSILWSGCVFIEPFLKLFVYLNDWLTACVAIERSINVHQGVAFNKRKSVNVARWIIIILPCFIIGTIIHEPIHRDLFKYTTERYKANEYESWMNKSEYHAKATMKSVPYEIDVQENMTNKSIEYEIQTHVLCVINYSRFLQDYNIVILFVHLIVPFIANLLCASYIIFTTARQRSIARNNQRYRKHIQKQLREHKQLVISPIILLILSLPRLIISVVSGCINVSHKPWLYLCGYFISFIPSMLVFVVFVLPSELYRKSLKEWFQNCRQRQ